LAVGVFPYLLKLLHNPVVEIRNALISIWTYVIGFDISCREELIKDIREKGESKFLFCLKSSECSYQLRTMAAFIHSEICNRYRIGQELFLEFGFHRIYSSLLSDPTIIIHTHLKKWIVFSLAKLCEDFIEAKTQCFSCEVHLSLYPLLQDSNPTVRIATIFALGNMIGASLSVCPAPLHPNSMLTPQQNMMRGKEIEIVMQIIESCSDGSAAVRREAVIAVSKVRWSLPCPLTSAIVVLTSDPYRKFISYRKYRCYSYK
jgi:regulatory associated protein of mTOR